CLRAKLSASLMLRKLLALVLILLVSGFAADEFTLYELLPPETHQFAITYDVTTTREGAQFFFNPIRPGSIATKERVIERSTGKELKFEVVNGKQAKPPGLVPPDTKDDAQFIKVYLPAPVPKGGETRLRIYKTYTDSASYYMKDGQLIFDRPLGIKRNTLVLPQRWHLLASASPPLVSTNPD